MDKITVEYETEYDKGDIVVFNYNDTLVIGVIESYYLEDQYVYYSIRISPTHVYTYTTEGIVAEWDIKMKIEENTEYLRKLIIEGED